MDKYIFRILLITTVYIVTVNTQTLFTEEYCWRDYEGIIPYDALAGGLDRNGRPIYIGQVIYDGKLIPGKIFKNDKNIYFEWSGSEYHKNENVKILCSQDSHKFEWLPSSSDQVPKLTNKILVRGGYEPNYVTYLGRALTDGETSVGKVICGIDSCIGLYTTDNGKQREHKVFEILSYNPKNESPYPPIIDVRNNAV